MSLLKKGNLQELGEYLRKGANVDYQGVYEQSLLYVASWNGHIDVVRKLLDAGADVGKPSKYGVTPLHVSSHNGEKEVVKLLLENGADVAATDFYGDTPLHHAAVRSHNNDVIDLLVTGGSDDDKRNNRGETPLATAVELSNIAGIRQLVPVTKDSASLSRAYKFAVAKKDNDLVQLIREQEAFRGK